MATSVTFNDAVYQLDAHGYLDPPDQWDENFANGMAKSLGILSGLTADHWKIIRYLRMKYLEEKTVPLVVYTCIDNRMRLSKMKILFPTGYLRGAIRIAGINFAFLCKTNIWLTYENYTTLKAQYPMTPTGFLTHFDRWDKRFCELVAEDWHLPDGLTSRHYRLIEFLRAYYRETHNIPTVYEACRSNGIEVDELRDLFPEGYRRGACRAAGLPFFS